MAKDTNQHKTAEEILAILRVELPEMRQRHGVRSLGLFGSVVRREARSNSDVDILVEFERAPTFFQFVALEDDLSKLLGARVDLVMKSALKPRIGERILSEVLPV
jgi:uncharacterized protein